VLDDPFELPKEWDDTLNTSGFWVLHVALLPSAEEPEAQAEAVHETVPAPPARPLWRRLLRLPARDSASGVRARHGAPVDEGRDHEPGDVLVPSADSAPAGVLVSADLYDLAELS
jgi:hypothetical protein